MVKKMENLQKLKGFREFYPEEMVPRVKIFNKMREISRSFNFKEIETPSVEPLEIFKIKSGEEIVKQTFSFVDKGGREITLVPEITPSVSRMVAQRKNFLKPIKWFSIPKLWRYEEPQSGRLREFYQYNADIFGSDNIASDAEVISLAMAILDSLGLKGKYVMRISDRELMEKVLLKLGVVEVEKTLRVIDRMGKVDEETFYRDLSSINGDEIAKEILKIIGVKGNFKDIEKTVSSIIGNEPRMETLWNLQEFLIEYGYGEFIFDFSIVRGLAYYTGIVFEAHDKKGEFRAILGGGRYDNVVELFGGEKVPAVGFGMGDAVLELLLKREGLWPKYEESVDYFIAIQGNNRKYGIKILTELRRRGYITDIDLTGKSLSWQLRYADKIGAKFIIIVGDEEAKTGTLKIKNMVTGEQKTVTLEYFDNKQSMS